MRPARTSKRRFERTKLLAVDPKAKTKLIHETLASLPKHLKEGDLLVVNRSGTLPAAFSGSIQRTGELVEVRLASFLGQDLKDFTRWKAVTFGSGDWKTPTEERGPAPLLEIGDLIQIDLDLLAIVKSVDPNFTRLVEIEFQSAQLLQSLYRHGRPIQYSYLREELKVWDQQTLFSGPPISTEPPSAAFPLNWQQILKLQRNGIQIASLIHGAGLSSTGDPKLDAIFPLDEYFEIPIETAMQIQTTRQNGGRIVAVGTTVVRALESAGFAEDRTYLKGRTTLRLSKENPVKVVDLLLTGMHEPGTSHIQLIGAFGIDPLTTLPGSETSDYFSHEYGDLTLVVR